MSEIDIRIEGCAGRITLRRPKALNALTYDMACAIEDALDAWAEDDAVALVVIDAEGDKAFCAGGDITRLYETGRAGDLDYGRRFWRDEYRLNAKIAEYEKPYVAFLHGFTMGGGVGIGCHGSHRVVCESSRISMPECSIGLVPDVGGSLLLAQAPGRMGEYLGVTGARMTSSDAILCGFTDIYIPQLKWPEATRQLVETGSVSCLDALAEVPPEGTLDPARSRIDALFDGEGLQDILNALRADDSDFAADMLTTIARNSPLSMACTIEMIHRLRAGKSDIRRALELEYRFTHRAMEESDFLEGIRAAVIDKDRSPKWQHTLDNPPLMAATRMLMPLGPETLTFQRED